MLEVVIDTSIHTFHLDLSLSAEMGKTTVLLGESGAGKSSVLRHVVGLQHPQRGMITLHGVTYFDSQKRIVRSPQERPFGYVFQDYALFPHLNVFENVAFGLRAQHFRRNLIRQRVGEVLEQVSLNGMDHRFPSQLSGGQQQRVALARALALRPQLLLLDEPLSALDVQTRREVRQQLRRILADGTLTTLLVTHNYLDALLFGHNIIVLDQGHIIQQGDQHSLVQHPRSSYVAELVGTNVFRGRILHSDTAMLCTLQLTNQSGHPILIQATLGEQGPGMRAPVTGEEAYVAVDPKSITLHQTLPEGSARNTFQGEIIHILQIEPSSPEARVDGRIRISILLEASTVPLTAELTAASATQMHLCEGQRIYATFKATEARAYM